jgi:hypothetical protein
VDENEDEAIDERHVAIDMLENDQNHSDRINISLAQSGLHLTDAEMHMAVIVPPSSSSSPSSSTFHHTSDQQPQQQQQQLTVILNPSIANQLAGFHREAQLSAAEWNAMLFSAIYDTADNLPREGACVWWWWWWCVCAGGGGCFPVTFPGHFGTTHPGEYFHPAK